MSLAQKSYLAKCHSCRIYKELSLIVKAHSVALYSKFQSWAEQDSRHQEILYETVVSEQPSKATSIAYPVPLEYNDQDAEPSGILSSIVQSVVSLEAVTVNIAQEAGFPAFAEISMKRIEELQRISLYIGNGSLYASHTPIQWVCTKCGLSIASKNAPEECLCCQAKTGAFVRYFEIGE